MTSARTAIRFDSLGSVVVSRLMGAGVLQGAPGIPVLMYHSVCDDREPGIAPYYRLVTSPARFQRQMQWLKQHGYAIVDLASALQRMQDAAPGWEKLVVVTFDDGFRDFLTGAWPVLANCGFIATVFLPTAFIGQARRSFKGRECLTWSEVRELQHCGVRFGSHTVTHPRLHGMTWTEIRGELADSRAMMEDELQAPVRSFAYPYAFPQEDHEFVARFKDELASQGYVVSATTAIGRTTPGHDPLSIPRLPVNDCDHDGLLAAKMAGAYDWVGGLQRAVRQTKRTAIKVRPA